MPSKHLAKATERISQTISRASQSYSAGEEKTQLSLTGIHGFAIIIHMGDGDEALTTRIYIDGSLWESFKANIFAKLYVTFTSSLSIRTYAASSGTYYRSACYINGFRRLA